MNAANLTSPMNALTTFANAFQHSRVCSLSVYEEKAFGKAGEFSLGEIELFPTGNGEAEGARETIKAIRNGAFEWRTPEAETAKNELIKLLSLGSLNGDAKDKADEKLRRMVDSFGAIPVRLGICHPTFDPRSLAAMPFRRPTTVVADTSGVLQGGLSFVGRFLHPAARIKVPAVVQMEIVNFADRFFSNKRSTKTKPIDLVIDHTKSQAAQRVLLKLELLSDIEIERTFLLGDPLRGAFQRDEDKELKELNMNVSIRAYADRLILEAVRQHQTQVSYGHPVMLLTSDQGQARMALAEGVSPLYFRSAKANAFFGRRLTGTNLHPFNGSLCTTSLADVLWELATTFGCARLTNKETSYVVSVYAMGEELAWAPYHSQDDLLWIAATPGKRADSSTSKSDLSDDSPAGKGRAKNESTQEIQTADAAVHTERIAGETAVLRSTAHTAQGSRSEGPALYKFSIDRMIALIDSLDLRQRLTNEEVIDVLGNLSKSGIVDYRRFLESGNAVVLDNKGWAATPTLSSIAIALRNKDILDLRKALAPFPSFKMIESELSQSPIGKPVAEATFGRAASTFTALAEITELGALIFGEGFYPTPRTPSDLEFAEMAINVYKKLDEGAGWVETGRWLEELIRSFGIHPTVARERLQTASERRHVRRVTEGSTTDTKFDRHMIRVLISKDGHPAVGIEHLYRGDFLIPGKASSSLRIERVNHEPA